MSLITCKECSREYSDSVSKCPHCGKAKPQSTAGIVGALIILAVLFFGAKSCCNSLSEEATENASRPKTTEELIKAQFSAWDGGHIKLERVIKESMNDPDSYESVRASYINNGDHLIVTQHFTGKNAMGGRVRHTVIAKTAMDGTVLEIISQD